ncbi:BZ3500_MvSof-1268-A1-R1_Chr8-1g09768 [Microbotryum saponariae]|uniref:BZ3500_MvSof-1268-A1-R1_Chr8-1g09768 protein n=1 Tax=Microbotryum saponariae TaxID=289078 RepID=A0A2X0LLN1_9BASI|nr:BZ3500_MvSof-1268-A1-R1_Chr8-1g09768 [Microbotryum saponariae]SDA08054.1 BZ3501_MvSof-1269-A2-R1_Chr8-1g09491 [Microbotryum saponariae]
MAIHPSATGTTLDKYCLEAWLVRISEWPCATLGALRRYIIKHPETIWFLPICHDSHWFLARLDVANNKWELFNSMASRRSARRKGSGGARRPLPIARPEARRQQTDHALDPTAARQLILWSCDHQHCREVLGEAAFDPGRPNVSRVRQFQRLLRDFPRRTPSLTDTLTADNTPNKVTAPTGVADDGPVEGEPLPSETSRHPPLQWVP